MILNRRIIDESVKGYYDSSNILASEYNMKTKDLIITFTYGGQYKYKDVKLTDFTRFEMAESQGIALNSHIKNAYTFESLGKVDIKLMKEELSAIKLAEIEGLKAEVVLYAREFVAMWDDTGVFSDPMLNKLVDVIKFFKDKSK